MTVAMVIGIIVGLAVLGLCANLLFMIVGVIFNLFGFLLTGIFMLLTNPISLVIIVFATIGVLVS